MSLIRKAAPLGWLFMAILCSFVFTLGAVAWFFLAIPDGADLDQCITTQMFQISLCKSSRDYTPLRLISPNVRNAVIASEDAAFWDHSGIDWVEMRRSFETNIEKGRIARGGSTITQQLAKNVYLSSEKSFLRKIREAVIAIRIERRFDKNLILEKYLNVVEFDTNVYGVKSAALHYFGTTPANLSIAQAAWLAHLLPNPKKYSLSYHKNKLTPFAFHQMREIIDRLWRFKKITEDEKIAATREAKSFFGGVSGESEESEQGLEQELEESTDPEPDATDSSVEKPSEVENDGT